MLKQLNSSLFSSVFLCSLFLFCFPLLFVSLLFSSALCFSSVFLCPFDISSLFTNVPLAETIQICAETLYNDFLTPPPLPRNVFVELMHLATSSVEFSFNNNMHCQIDGVAMGSLLGPDIFVGYQELKLFSNTNKPLANFRYVNDTFAAFNNEDDCNNFFTHLNSLHPSLRFTQEKNLTLSFPFWMSW